MREQWKGTEINNSEEIEPTQIKLTTWTQRDFVVLGVVLVLAFAIALGYLRTVGQRSDYVLPQYATAVMVALGHGFQKPDLKQVPAIDDFVNLRSSELDISALPNPIPTVELDYFPKALLYSMYTVGYWWRIFGISWEALDTLHALLFSICCGFAYAIFRLVANQVIAGICTALILFSPTMLYILPQFRDFSKAPFMLALFYLLGIAVRFPLRPLKWGLLSALIGLILGLGLGFRRDLLVFLPPTIGILLFLTSGNFRSTLPRRIATIAICLLCLVAASAPILKAFQKSGPTSTHTIALGLSEYYDSKLGISATPYRPVHMYQDAYMHTRIISHMRHLHNAQQEAQYMTASYDAAGRTFLHDVHSMFPSDFLTRWYSSVKTILDHSPFIIDPFYPKPEFLNTLMHIRTVLLGYLEGWGAFLGIATVLIIAAFNMRIGLATVFLTLYFAGYTCLQFHSRHYFVLEIIFFWLLAFWGQGLLSTGICLYKKEKRAEVYTRLKQELTWSRIPFRLGLFVIILTIVLGGSYTGAWYWQDHNVSNLYKSYFEADLHPLETRVQRNETLSAFFPQDFMTPESVTPLDRANRVQHAMIVVELAPMDSPLPLYFQYQADSTLNDFSWQVTVPPHPEQNVRVFYPLYNTTDNYFSGGQRRFSNFVVPKEFEDRVIAVEEVTALQELPMMLTLVLPEKWQKAPRHMWIAPFSKQSP